MKNLLYWSTVIVLLSACERTTITNIDNNPTDPISDIPSIELESVSATTVQEFKDSLVFSIKYIDGNGDLGSTNPDEHSIELVDNRDLSLIFTYHLSPRAPAGTDIIVKGTIDIVLNNTILLDANNNSETTTFSIRIKDEAGNWSNSVTTETIIITK